MCHARFLTGYEGIVYCNLMRKVKQALEMANREAGFGRVGAPLVLAVLVDDQ